MPVISRPSKLFQRTICCSAKPGSVDSRRCVRPGPGLRAAVGGDQRADLARALAAAEREGEDRQPRMEVRRPDAALGQRRRGQLVEGVGVEEHQVGTAFDLGPDGEQPAVVAEARVFDVALDVAGDRRDPGVGERIEHQLAKLAAAVADEEEARVVSLPCRSQVHGLVGAARRGQDAGALAAGQVEQPDLGLVGGKEPVEREAAVVPRRAADVPAAARKLGELAPAVGVRRIDQGQRLHDLGAPPAGGGAIQRHRGVDQPAAQVQPAGQLVPHVRLGDDAHLPGGEVEAVDLRRLVAAGAALEDDRVAGPRLVARLRHRLGEIGELLELAHRRREAIDLRGAGAGLAIGDEHVAPARMPVDEAVAAEVGVARDVLDDAGRNRRDALEHELVVGLHPVAGSGRGRRGRGGGARRRRGRRHRRAGREKRGRGEGGERES